MTGPEPDENERDGEADRIERLEAENEQLRERLDELEARIDEEDDESDGGPLTNVTRRGVMAAAATLGVASVGTGSAAAATGDHLAETWSGDPGTHGLRTDVGPGTNVAFYGGSDSTSARALKGVATATSGRTIGVEGKASSPDSVALLGNATATQGAAKGLEGRSEAKFGTGVVGNAKHPSGATKGLRGIAGSPNGRGVEATNTATSGAAYGVYAETNSPTGYGIYTPDDARVDGSTVVSTVKSPSGTPLRVYTNEDTQALVLGLPGTDGSGNTAGANVLAGHPNNSISGAVGAVVGGGGSSGSQTVDGNSRSNANAVLADYGTVAGGKNNRASGLEAVVGGGEQNTASAENATVGGGDDNTASALGATVSGGGFNAATARLTTVGGGRDNVAEAKYATIAGGGPSDTSNPSATNNVADGSYGTIGGGGNNQVGDATSGTTKGAYATVPGGRNNTADGDYSLAAGRNADTGGHDGAFVWGDSTSTAVTAAASDEVVFQAGGSRSSGVAVEIRSQSDGSAGVALDAGSGSWGTLSARATKRDIEPVDSRDVLETLDEVSISTWRYENQPDGVQHMGPMAREFNEAFELGTDPERITNVDADGVALAAIKGLAERIGEKEERLDTLEEENESLRRRNERLEERLTSLDERLASLEGGGPTATSADD